MLAGILLAGYALPGSTPLRIFLIASAACFVIGNIFLVREIKRVNAEARLVKNGPWPHLFRVLVILAISWLFILLFSRFSR
jgi:hypothetical protein